MRDFREKYWYFWKKQWTEARFWILLAIVLLVVFLIEGELTLPYALVNFLMCVFIWPACDCFFEKRA